MAEADRDELEPPGVRSALIAWIGAGAVIFVVVASVALGFFYCVTTPAEAPFRVGRFPVPSLETTIDPRSIPASLPGPVQPTPPRPNALDPARITRAMQQVAARGARGYDPIPTPTAPGGAS